MKITLKNLWKLFGLDKVDWKKATTVLLTVLWSSLIFCLLSKVLLGKSFEVMTNNLTYINICEFLIRTNLWVIVYFPFYLLSCCIVSLTILIDKPRKNHIFIILGFTLSFIIKYFSPYIGFALEIILYYSLTYKKGWRKKILFLETVLLQMLFDRISFYVKGLGIYLEKENVVTSLILMGDYYFMLGIHCVNNYVRKEGIIMGLLGPFFMSKRGKQLVSYRTKLVEKRIKLDSKIKEIDRVIENEKDK